MMAMGMRKKGIVRHGFSEVWYPNQDVTAP
jgi:hypothetical protein